MSKRKSVESIKSIESIESVGKRNAGCQPASEKSVESGESIKSIESKDSEKTGFWLSLGKTERLFVVGLIGLLSLSVFGFAFTKYEGGRMKDETSAKSLNVLNPDAINATNATNALTPVTSTTPQLSKEYIYAGSRMLAVEDANSNASPPADLAVWRPSNGYFYVLGGPGSTQTFAQWGTNGDVPVPGDFDGDGKTDFSIYRPTTGTWWIVKSSLPSESISLQFGAVCTPPNGCDKVAPADYDGDGKTDAAVFRPDNGTWYILQSGSGNSFYSQQFGLTTDQPAPADYDGDGKADIGVWRDSNKTFYSSKSSSGQLSVASVQEAGSGNNTPISGDYDGDGRADFAIRSGNNWIIKNSSNNQTQTIEWQTAGDIAVQNDYDGDGKVDIATWNNTTGNWSIRQSGTNNSLRTVQWGMTGDIPVPAYYRR